MSIINTMLSIQTMALANQINVMNINNNMMYGALRNMQIGKQITEPSYFEHRNKELKKQEEEIDLFIRILKILAGAIIASIIITSLVSL